MRGGERELQLLRGEVQVAGGDLVLGHVEVRVPGIPGRARGECREADLVGCRRNVVEQVEQHRVRFGRPAGGHERFGVADRHRHVTRKELFGPSEGRERLVDVSGLGLRLAERDPQQRQAFVLLHQRLEYLHGLFGVAAVH